MSFLNTQDHALSRGISVINDPIGSIQNFEEVYKQVLTKEEVREVIAHFEKSGNFYSVDENGHTSEEATGSRRIITHDKAFAQFLTKKLWSVLRLTPVVLNKQSRVDWQSDNPDELNYWVPLHVSPMFRYMRYHTNGIHAAHYDSEFKSPDNPLIRTLMSGVLYLTSNACYTRLLHDNQDAVPHQYRDLADWTVPVEDKDIRRNLPSAEGFTSVFPHGFCHDVSPNLSLNDRIVIRYDIFYQAVDKV